MAVALRAAAEPPAQPTSPAPPRSEAQLDWCAPIAVRPDQRFDAQCVPGWTPDEIASRADVVLLGDVYQTSASLDPSLEVPCLGALTHERERELIDDLRRRAGKLGRTLAVAHMHRFDLVTPPFVRLPDFPPGAVLRGSRRWSQVEALFAGDRSPDCATRPCRLLDGPPNTEKAIWSVPFLLRKRGAADLADAAVYYLARPEAGQRDHWPLAAVADLRNAEYRAFRVAEAKRALAAGGYDTVDLNHKLHQYQESSRQFRPNLFAKAQEGRTPGHWIGSTQAPDVSALNATADTWWSSPPAAYTYADYVDGWAKLAADLRAAGVPYSVLLPAEIWTGAYFDDRSTDTVDEAASLRGVAAGARFVVVTATGAQDEAWKRAETALAQAGVAHWRARTECGYGGHRTPGF